MRTLLSIVIFLATLACCVGGSASADAPSAELVLHVDEGAPGGQIVGNLPELLGFKKDAKCRLMPDSDDGFEINPTGQLTVAANARLNHENQSTRVLTLEVLTSTAADLLHKRFVGLLNDSPTAGEFVEDSLGDRQVVRIHVVIDDLPEPPQLMRQVFRTIATSDVAPGQEVGRVIAVDPDAGDRLQFRLCDTNSLLRIDPDSGRLSFHQHAALPDVSRIRATVEVVDSQGLSDSRQIVIPLAGHPKPPANYGAAQPAVASAGSGDTDTAGSNLVTDLSTSVATSENVVNQSATDGPNPAETATSAQPIENGPRNEPSGPPQQSAAPVAGQLNGAMRQTTGETNRTAWVLICVVCVIVLGIMCWAPLQQQSQKLILQPESTDAALSDGSSIDQQSSDAETSPRTPPGPPASADGERTPSFSGKKDARELNTLLESLDESFGLSPAGSAGTGETSGSQQSRASARRGEAGTNSSAADQEQFVIYNDGPDAASSTTATTTAKQLTFGTAATDAPLRNSAAKSPGVEPVQSGKPERAQIEQFRQISRTYSRADISRRRRGQMRVEWMSRGAAVASSFITGTICLFTNCFGAISVPCGTVLLAVTAALLMKRSLYFDDTKPIAAEAPSTNEPSAPPAES